MALFGTDRDYSFITGVNKELLHDIISQQITVYKIITGETMTNIYGEADKGRFFLPPKLLYCLINRNPQDWEDGEAGPDLSRTIEVSFFRDELIEKDIFIEIGDVFMYEEGYYEVNSEVENQYFLGKNKEFVNLEYDELGNQIPNTNPDDNNLNKFGRSVSLVFRANYIPSDKLNLSPYKERI